MSDDHRGEPRFRLADSPASDDDLATRTGSPERVSGLAKTPAQTDRFKPVDELSRREWLLNFGSAIVLSGFAGIPGEALPADDAAAAALPPGLYTPSIEHVTHALNSDGPFFPFPPGAETEFVRPRSGPYIPQAFTPEEFRLVLRLVEIVLGDDLKAVTSQSVTGAPQNSCDEVADWIDLVVSSGPRVRAAAHNLTPEQRALSVAYFTSEALVRELETYQPEKVCREGLAWLQQESQSRFAENFLNLSGADQLLLITSISDSRPDATVVSAGTRFFDFLKAESIRGFYTSQPGLQELDYRGNAFYGNSPGCSPAV